MEDADGYPATVAEAAGALLSLRFADLGERQPPWGKQMPALMPDPAAPSTSPGTMAVYDDRPEAAATPSNVPIWPAEARGKRSRRTVRMARWEAVAAAAGKGSRRPSPASPLDYSGGSGASTSGGGGGGGGEDGSSSPEERPQPPTAADAGRGGPTTASKVRSTGDQPLLLRLQPPLCAGTTSRPRKKMRLPEIKESVRSLTEANELLRKAVKDLRTACHEMSDENRELEARLEERNARGCAGALTIPGEKQRRDIAPPSPQSHESVRFRLPDLNLPVPE